MRRHTNDRDRDQNQRNQRVGFEPSTANRGREERERAHPYLNHYEDRFIDPYERDLHPRTAGGNFAGKGPKGFRRSDDRIREDVCSTITQHPGVDGSDLDVDVSFGVVTLKGTVQERRMKHLAEIAAENLPGVKEVINQIRVRRAEDFRTGRENAERENSTSKDQHH
jgi:hypothetical protein